jgi:F-type H+-transporting ATPase subunit delta
MVNVSVARRYARALLDAAAGQADVVLSELTSLVAFFDQNPALFEAASSPALPASTRMQAVVAVIKSADQMQPTLANLLKLLSDRNRFDVLPVILRQYRDLVDAQLGRVRGTVSSAVKLGDAQLAGIQQQLETLTKKKVVLQTKVDASLLGGVVAQVGSRTYDGSLKEQLRTLGQELSRPTR